MKTIILEIDNSCEECQKALRRISAWQKQHLNHYGSVCKKTGKFIKGIVLRLDYNAFGNRTHYHIENE